MDECDECGLSVSDATKESHGCFSAVHSCPHEGQRKEIVFSHRLHERDTDGQMALPRTSDRNFRMARWESSPFYLGVPRNAVRQRTFGFVLGTVNLQVN